MKAFRGIVAAMKRTILLICFSFTVFAGTLGTQVPEELIELDLRFTKHNKQQIYSYIKKKMLNWRDKGFCKRRDWDYRKVDKDGKRYLYNNCVNIYKDYIYDENSEKLIKKYRASKSSSNFANLKYLKVESEDKISKRALRITKSIVLASEVMKVDRTFLLSLIEHESLFEITNQNSGGTGLTQFVQDGIKENLEQLGVLHDKDIDKNVISTWRKYYERISSRLSGIDSNFPALRTLDQLKNVKTKVWRDTVKKYLKTSTNFAAFFGALHLKVKFSGVCSEKKIKRCNEYAKRARKGTNRWYLMDIYHNALRSYNGNTKKMDCSANDNKYMEIRDCYPLKVKKVFKEAELYFKTIKTNLEINKKNRQELSSAILYSFLRRNFQISRDSIKRETLSIAIAEAKNEEGFITKACREGKKNYVGTHLNLDREDSFQASYLLSQINCQTLEVSEVEILVEFDEKNKVFTKLEVKGLSDFGVVLDGDCSVDTSFTKENKNNVFSMLKEFNIASEKIDDVKKGSGFSTTEWDQPKEACLKDFENYLIEFDYNDLPMKKGKQFTSHSYKVIYSPAYQSIVSIELKK